MTLNFKVYIVLSISGNIVVFFGFYNTGIQNPFWRSVSGELQLMPLSCVRSITELLQVTLKI